MIVLDSLQTIPMYSNSHYIYFLMFEGKIVYVGQSVNYLFRIAQHKKEGVKIFDSFKVCNLPLIVDIDFVEFCEIADRKPVYNTSLPGLDFLLTISDIKKLSIESQECFDLGTPDYSIVMPKRTFNYWKMAGFKAYYKALDMCRGLEIKEIEQ